MSVRISLDNPPEFYTNLDEISGHVFLGISRPEVIGNIVVKLEGESRTALAMAPGDRRGPPIPTRPGTNVATENHKLLYRVQQVFPDENRQHVLSTPAQNVLHPGQHKYRFHFKMPLNNICHDPQAMYSLAGGVGGVGGPGQPGILSLGGFRTMDGTRQLMLQHVKTTLPPSLTGFPQEAEIRYYLKVTIQRPGFFKENWRYQLGFKFLPIEPPRAPPTSQEAFARRPFTFTPRTPLALGRKKSSFFSSSDSKPPPSDSKEPQAPPSIEVSARLPHPSLLTCNETIPLRLIAKKLADVNEQVYLTGLEVVLVGLTQVRVQHLQNVEMSRWIIVSASNLSIALGSPDAAVDSEFEIPNHLWADKRLPNTVAPSFKACNLGRRYELELQLSLSWGLRGGKGATALPQVIRLPLKLSNVSVLSGIKPPPGLLASASAANDTSIHTPRPPKVPPRPGQAGSSQSAYPSSSSGTRPAQAQDPLYPPQLGSATAANYDDAPPSYDEAMAANVPGPDASSRPAYSGVTAENAPSTLPEGRGEKGGLH